MTAEVEHFSVNMRIWSESCVFVCPKVVRWKAGALWWASGASVYLFVPVDLGRGSQFTVYAWVSVFHLSSRNVLCTSHDDSVSSLHVYFDGWLSFKQFLSKSYPDVNWTIFNPVNHSFFIFIQSNHIITYFSYVHLNLFWSMNIWSCHCLDEGC